MELGTQTSIRHLERLKDVVKQYDFQEQYLGLFVFNSPAKNRISVIAKYEINPFASIVWLTRWILVFM